MDSIINHDFKEAKLGPEFCKKEVIQIKRLIDSSISFSVVGMPAMGISIFLRYLASRNFAHFIHVDLYELPELTGIEVLKLLLKELGGTSRSRNYLQLIESCKQRLAQLAQKHKRVVIIFNRFDQLKKEIDRSFFNNLRSLRDVDKERIVIIFTANKPLYEIAPEAIDVGNLNMYSKTFYLKPYSKEELMKLLRVNTPQLIPKKDVLEKALRLCGGHYQLLQLLLKSERLESPLLDVFIRTQLKQIYELLNFTQRKQVRNIAMGKPVHSVDEYLTSVGIVKTRSEHPELFTPLFPEFVKSMLPFRLPVKETRLFRLLKQHEGNVVSKDEIYETVWPEDPVEASEWSLNALVYRLRKNPAFAATGYTIENRKKVGYLISKI